MAIWNNASRQRHSHRSGALGSTAGVDDSLSLGLQGEVTDDSSIKRKTAQELHFECLEQAAYIRCYAN
ncbi:hypothetical protein J6590_080155 [Homalodisca vitripennis]|nr:hypothetical protein J6590_080155 [Homalodisca vitripennis]